jgi:hypothetical protein
MSRSTAEIVREYGPFFSVDSVHGVTYDGLIAPEETRPSQWKRPVLIVAAPGLSAAPAVEFHASDRTAASDTMVLCYPKTH